VRILLQIALRNLVQSRRRTTILMLAIGSVTGMLVFLLALSQGVNDNLVKSATTVSAGMVNVAGFYKVTPGSVAPMVTNAAALRKVVEAKTPGLAYVLERHRGFGKLVSSTGAVQAGFTGLVPAEEGRLFDTLQLAKESEYKEGGRDEVVGNLHGLEQPNSVVLFVAQAKRLGVIVGDVVTIQTETTAGRTNTADATVVAIARDFGFLSSWVCYMPKELILQLYQIDADTTGALWIYLDDIANAESAMGTVRDALRDAGYTVMEHDPNPFWMKLDRVSGEDWVGQQIDVTVWSDEVSFLTWVILGFKFLTWGLTVIQIVTVAAGIMNAMWQAVRERTREIGTMRAIGLTRTQTLVLFILEAALLGFGATALGALVAGGGSLVVDLLQVPITYDAARAILLADTLHLAPTLQASASAIVALTLLTAAAALLPALRAARMQPVKALQHIE
jgi:putative ABC transport system permease protein